ncbi:hypothetical protein GCM10010245_84270 [Streptomyces spectabilis]|nr:hypothetical protein GCM10010245_84270 [Streptomyces spectabilis]
MAPQHGPRRAQIVFSDSAAKQLESITSEAEIHALDRALVVVSVDPEVGEPIPGGTVGLLGRRRPAAPGGDGCKTSAARPRRVQRSIRTAQVAHACCTGSKGGLTVQRMTTAPEPATRTRVRQPASGLSGRSSARSPAPRS